VLCSGGQWNSGGSCDKETEPITIKQVPLEVDVGIPKLGLVANISETEDSSNSSPTVSIQSVTDSESQASASQVTRTCTRILATEFFTNRVARVTSDDANFKTKTCTGILAIELGRAYSQ
jgi:hypothetical protein